MTSKPAWESTSCTPDAAMTSANERPAMLQPARPGHPQAAPAVGEGPPVVPARRVVHELTAEPRAHARVVQTPERRLVAAVLHPGREQHDGARRAGDVRMDVCRHLHPGATGGVDAVDQHGGLVPVVAPGRLDVAVVQVASGPGGHVDHLVGRLDDAVALRAHVHEEREVAGGDHLAQRGHLIGARIGGRHVDEAGGEPARALVERPDERLLHLLDLAVAGLAGVVAHDEPPDRGVPDERSRPGRRAGANRTEILPEGPPRPQMRGDAPVEPCEQRRLTLEVAVGNRGGGDAVLTEDLGRAPLEQLRGVAERRSLRPADHRVEIRVRMEVDEARCENEAGPLDDLGAQRRRAPAAPAAPDATSPIVPLASTSTFAIPGSAPVPSITRGSTNPKRRPRPPPSPTVAALDRTNPERRTLTVAGPEPSAASSGATGVPLK